MVEALFRYLRSNNISLAEYFVKLASKATSAECGTLLDYIVLLARTELQTRKLAELPAFKQHADILCNAEFSTELVVVSSHITDFEPN